MKSTIFDPELLSDLLEMEKQTGTALFANLLAEFKSEYSQTLDDLPGWLANKQFKFIERASHNLKSSCRYLGAKAAMESSERMEKLAAKSDLHQLQIEVRMLQSLAEKTWVALDAYAATLQAAT